MARGRFGRRTSQGRDEGFTLLELLIVCSILPLVIGGVAVAMIASFGNEAAVSATVAGAHDAQITSAYFVRDVQAASSISTSPNPVCPSATTTSQLLGLRWFNGDTPVSVTYSLSTTSSPTFLMRSYCDGSQVPVTTTVVNDAFTSLGTPTVSNACAAGVSSCATSGRHVGLTVAVACQGGGSSCANGGLIPSYPSGSTNGILSVTLTANELPSGYQYVLTASPRNQATQILLPPGSAGPPLVLLGTSSPALSCANKSGVTVNGAVAVNSSMPGSLSFGPHSSLQASDVYSETLSPPGSPVTPPSAYTGPTSQGPAFPDPYSGLPDPTSATQYAGTSIVGPGEYTNPSGVSITSSINLAPGIYIFDHGLSVSGTTGTVLSGSGVMFFIGIPNAAPDVPQTAAYNVSGNGTIKLTAPTTGTYAGISIFQSRSDPTPMGISGNGATNAYGGVIYAPDATVNAFGNGSVATGSIVAGALGCGGNGGVSIGFAVISSAPQSSPILSGGNDADVVSVIGVPGLGAPEGLVTFYVCGPAVAPGSCTSANWTQVGATVALTTGADDASTATSASAAYTTPGTWCFVAAYNPNGHPNYGASSDTSTDGCFVVQGPTVALTFPVNGGAYHLTGKTWNSVDPCTASTGAICGSATDVGGTITKVEYSISQSGAQCWNGTSWTGTCPSWSTTTLGTPSGSTWPWSQAWQQSWFTLGDTYTLSVRATDSLGLTTTTTVTFTIS